jgi:hypothetical protein
MADRVDPGDRGHSGRLGQCQFRVEDRGHASRLRIPASHLGLGPGIGNQGVGLHFAARAAGSRNTDQGQELSPSFARSPIILHLAAAGEQEVCPFGRIETAATSQPHKQVRSEFLCRRDRLFDLNCGRILGRAVKNRAFQSILAERIDCFGHMASSDDPRIGDDHGPLAPQLVPDSTYPGNRASPLDHAGPQSQFFARDNARLFDFRAQAVHARSASLIAGAGGMAATVFAE